jgi:hypothetical protein
VAALGGEVAAEAEHVRPRFQPQVLEFGEFAAVSRFLNDNYPRLLES